MVRSIAVAASILFAIVLSVFLYTGNQTEPKLVAKTQSKVADSSTLAVLHHEINSTGKEKRISLPDGSLVVLADKSELSYFQPFTDTRNLSLIGKAFFKVAKDQTKAFTVISGDISTTALGTEFTVSAFKNTKEIVVNLYEGKVVIKPVDKENRKFRKEVYLLPGQTFVYDAKKGGRVLGFKLKSSRSPEVIMHEEDNPILPQDKQGSWYMFNNQSLEQVLEELAAFYNMKIVYNKNDVEKIYFTGKYNKTESLETILKRIGTLNNFTITKTDSAFILTK